MSLNVNLNQPAIKNLNMQKIAQRPAFGANTEQIGDSFESKKDKPNYVKWGAIGTAAAVGLAMLFKGPRHAVRNLFNGGENQVKKVADKGGEVLQNGKKQAQKTLEQVTEKVTKSPKVGARAMEDELAEKSIKSLIPETERTVGKKVKTQLALPPAKPEKTLEEQIEQLLRKSDIIKENKPQLALPPAPEPKGLLMPAKKTGARAMEEKLAEEAINSIK